MTEQSALPLLGPDEVEVMLSMATTGEAGSHPSATAVDFSQLTASEIVSAIHCVHDSQRRVQLEHFLSLGHPVDPVEIEDVHRRLAQYDVNTLLDEMPNFVGIEKTRDVFTLLAASRSVADRQTAVSYMGALTLVDHDGGLELWKKLLMDDEHPVAMRAWESVKQFSFDAENPQETADSLAQDGLTWPDFLELTNTYIGRLEALRDRGTHPGELAS